MLSGSCARRSRRTATCSPLVVVLQFVGDVAMLYLPSLNADIIDQGVATGRHRLHRAHRRHDAARSRCVQIVCSHRRRLLRRRGRRWPSAATCAPRSSTGSASFSAREVGHFGAPSLITRNTNDVQQVQMLVLMACTMMVSRADHDGRRHRDGAARGRRARPGCSRSSVPALVLAVGFMVSRMVPSFRLMQARIDAVNRVLREQITGIRVVRAFVREPYETRAVRRANDELTDVATSRRPAGWRRCSRS